MVNRMPMAAEWRTLAKAHVAEWERSEA